jgi:hypothetical protein
MADVLLSPGFSLVLQIDGLIFKCQGGRIERDVFAQHDNVAVCKLRGRLPFESAGSFLGWYAAAVEMMPEVVATVASHRGLGVFVVPLEDEGGPSIRAQRSGRATPWLAFLQQHVLMSFVLPEGGFTPRVGRPMRAVLAQFGVNGEFKACPRQEREFTLECIPELRIKGPHLGVRPHLLQRASPLAAELAPSQERDVLAELEGGFEVDESAPPLAALPSRFREAAWTSDI